MSTLKPSDLFVYQRQNVIHQLTHDDSMLWLGMGLGKTPITLTTIVDRMRAGQVQKTLIFGPLRVIQAVWARESRKWGHTNHLRFSVVHGTREKRSRALFADADIYLINYENMNWLAEQLDHYYLSQGKPLPFQMVVYDECFAAGTPISTPHGDKPIEEIEIGDIVDTHDGPKPVTDVIENSASEMLSVKLSNGNQLSVTLNHPFLVSGSWVPACKLKSGDLLHGQTQDTKVWADRVPDLPSYFLETTRRSKTLFKELREQMERKTTSHHQSPQRKVRSETHRIRVEYIVHIKQRCSTPVWNLSVSESETYFAGGVLVHNCTKLKNSTTLRMAGGKRDRKDGRGDLHEIKVTGWRKMIPHFKYRTGLTGTPASNGYLDLFGQYLAVDGGQRLGEYITHYKDNYFASDYNGWGYTPTELGKQWIEHKISDITVKMDVRDYLDLPDCNVTNLMVDLPAAARRAYAEVEKEMFTQLDSGSEIEVFSRSSVSNKCLQFCLAEGTEVLTDSGWKLIEQFTLGDKVWDGVKWVNVYSLAFQGVKRVVELDGVWMTPDHRVLTMSGWKEAEDILSGDASDRFDRVEVRLPNCIKKVRINRDREKTEERNVVSSLHLRERVSCYWSKLTQPPQTRHKILRMSPGGSNTQCNWRSRNDQDTAVCDLDQHEITLPKSERQRLPELRWSWSQSMRQMVRFICSILGGNERRISRSPDDRAFGQQRALPQRKLQMGDTTSAGKQSAQQHLYQHSFGKNDSDSGGAKIRIQRCDIVCQNKERVERRTPAVTTEVKKTYDLINTGDLHRFTVRGINGEVFLAHNCNGSPYLSPESTEFEAIHDAKLDALEEVLEEAAGSPVLCSYSFVADAKRIMKKFNRYHPVNITDSKSSDTEAIIDKWNRGEIKLMIGHPASVGHGVDGLQDSGHILVWFGLNWSLELYEQMIGRIDRQGQKQPVSVIRILCNDTVDLAVADALERKTDDQDGLKSAIQRYRDGITTNDLEVNFF